jgi:hypothetical protein
LVLALVIGTFVWKGGLGFFATSREVTWRLAVPYADVRKVSLEVWREEALLRKEERIVPQGLADELTQEIVMRRGTHRGIAKVWLATDAAPPRVFESRFDPKADSFVVLEMKNGDAQPPGSTENDGG